MKQLTLIIILLGWVLSLGAQPNQPYWIQNRPQTDKNSMYYYRVTMGEGINYDKAYANAFAKAILESSWKLGVEVKTTDDLQTIENNIHDNINVAESTMVLPLNKVCEFQEPQTNARGIRLYILWQVAKYGNRAPQFDEFTKCE